MKLQTIADRYGQAMQIDDAEEADAYFQQLVSEVVRTTGMTRAHAERLERNNIGYFAGYMSRDVRLRCEQFYKAIHPVLGPVLETEKLTPEQIFERGIRWAEASDLFIRIKRDGEWQNVSVMTMNEEELKDIFETRDDPRELRRWIYALVKMLRERM